MQVVTGKEMQLIEKQAMETLDVSPSLLMENAGSRIVEFLSTRYGPWQNKRIHILVGPGNNGGDGLVVARQLLLKGARVKIYLIGDFAQQSPQSKGNLEFLRKMKADLTTVDFSNIARLRFSLSLADLIIDAIFGTGFQGGLDSNLMSLADLVNDLGRPVVAIDIPSGVDSETGKIDTCAFCAEFTINLGLPKLGCFLYPGRLYAGQVEIADLGFPLDIQGVQPRRLLGQDILQSLPPRTPWGHKGTFGHTLVVGGSQNYGGAPYLSGHAVLRGGGGMATVAVPEQSAIRFPPDELIVVPLPQNEKGTLSEKAWNKLESLLVGKDVLVVGPGLGLGNSVEKVVQRLLATWRGPVVIDADALRALSKEFLESLSPAIRKRWVITPHPGEMSRLVTSAPEYVDENRLSVASDFAARWGMTVILKGAPTIVTTGENVYINTTGNHGLATAGTGDVLAGLIGALLSQGLPPLKAAAAGVYIHGAAGDLGARSGARGLMARDCLENLRKILQEEV